MPKKAASTSLERAFAVLAGALERSGAPFMAIGGIAAIAHGVRRLTTDIDVVVQGNAVDLKSLLRRLARARIMPRIESAESFARENLVLLMRHMPTGVDLDISLGFTQFELEALAARRRIRFGNVEAPFARPEDILIFKALAARPKDMVDARALLAMHPGIDLARVRRRVRELSVLAEAPELLDGLEAVVAEAAAARDVPQTPRSKAKRPSRTVRKTKVGRGKVRTR